MSMTQHQVKKKLNRLLHWTRQLLDSPMNGEQYDRHPVILPGCNNIECLLLSNKGRDQREAIKRLYQTIYNAMGEYT